MNHIFQSLATRVIGNGVKTLFREDRWLGEKSLADRYPRLYNLTFSKKPTVQEVRTAGIDSIVFRRVLHDETDVQWDEVLKLVAEVEIREDQDRVRWHLNNKNKFVVKELYLLLKTGRLVGYISLWKLKIPHKIKIFLWLMLRNSILTKDNLLRRAWAGNTESHFCGAKKIINHLFFDYALARLIWQVVAGGGLD